MASPMTDAKLLAELVYAAWRVRDMVRGVDWYVEAATAVRDAVCPPDTHIVVPRAELEALIAALENARFGPPETYTARFIAIYEAYADYRAALDKESQ